MSPDRTPGIGQSEDFTVKSDADRKIESIYRSMTDEGITGLLSMSSFTTRPGSLYPWTPEFEKMPKEMQGRLRRYLALVVFGAAMDSIATILTQGRFDPWDLYRRCGRLVSGTNARNPLLKPDSPISDVTEEELEKMRKIHKEDPTNIRLFNVGLQNLPHTLRQELRRSGMPLLTIQSDIIFEYAERLEKEGISIPKTFKAKMKKRPAKPPAEETFLDYAEIAYIKASKKFEPRRKVRERHSKSIWPR